MSKAGISRAANTSPSKRLHRFVLIALSTVRNPRPRGLSNSLSPWPSLRPFANKVNKPGSQAESHSPGRLLQSTSVNASSVVSHTLLAAKSALPRSIIEEIASSLPRIFSQATETSLPQNAMP